MTIILARIFFSAVILSALLMVARQVVRHRRVKNRARNGQCERCGYSLVGLTSTTCPECAHPVEAAQTKFRRKSAQRAIIAASIGLVVSVASFVSLYYLVEWPSRVPNAVLLRIAPIGYTPSKQAALDDMRRELLDRVVTKKIPPQELKVLLERQVENCSEILVCRRLWPREVPLRGTVFMPEIVPIGIKYATRMSFESCPRKIERIDYNGSHGWGGHPDLTWKTRTDFIPNDCINDGLIRGTAHVGVFVSTRSPRSAAGEHTSSHRTYAWGSDHGRFVSMAERQFELQVDVVESVDDVLEPIDNGKIDRIMRNDVTYDITAC